jgi:hypothetical protein
VRAYIHIQDFAAKPEANRNFKDTEEDGRMIAKWISTNAELL